ncbi:hypothetical protein CVT25_001021 [Psilocybe cyanescens]|uniref:Uncharacterized protein n=1 Tax=Psilocybe cyanescens TaxID=93625 RepID=A0A409X8T4_PSICY|nr:hypothetical protein CVT25_001021 [Psilocybe cyanescens]
MGGRVKTSDFGTGYYDFDVCYTFIFIFFIYPFNRRTGYDNATPQMTRKMRLYDALYTQLPRFEQLHTLVLDSTVVSLHTYYVRGGMRALRTLSLVNCTYIRLANKFRDQIGAVRELAESKLGICSSSGWRVGLLDPMSSSLSNTAAPMIAAPTRLEWSGSRAEWAANMHIPSEYPFGRLCITALVLDRIHRGESTGGNDWDQERNTFHPMGLVFARGLEKLRVVWTPGAAEAWEFAWATYGEDGGDAPWSCSGIAKWTGVLYNIKDLDVTIPMLTRDLVNTFVAFVGCCTRTDILSTGRGKGKRKGGEIGRGPRIRLVVEQQTFSEQDVGTVLIPVAGVWSYEGPLAFARTFLGVSGIEVDGGNDENVNTNANTNTDRRLRKVVMTESLELPALLRGLEHLPQSVQSLEVRMQTWDVEVFLAVRKLFQDMRELVVWYGGGEFGEDFFATLGTNTLSDLPNLTILKLMRDTLDGLFGGDTSADDDGPSTLSPLSHSPARSHTKRKPKPPLESQEQSLMNRSGLRDYLARWGRYCKMLSFPFFPLLLLQGSVLFPSESTESDLHGRCLVDAERLFLLPPTQAHGGDGESFRESIPCWVLAERVCDRTPADEAADVAYCAVERGVSVLLPPSSPFFRPSFCPFSFPSLPPPLLAYFPPLGDERLRILFFAFARSTSASTSRSARNLKLHRPSLNFPLCASYNAGTAGNVQGHIGAPLTSNAVGAPISGYGAGAGGSSRSSSLASRKGRAKRKDVGVGGAVYQA